jgi:4-amino-4-deoxy-L-arabinose transferase-like glycosyltransferase
MGGILHALAVHLPCVEPRVEARGASRSETRLWALGVAGLAFVMVFVATRHGLGVTPDSVFYITVARNLADGRGFVDFAGHALTHWPPGLSLLLAGGTKLGLSIETTARLVNASSAALIVWLTYQLGERKFRSRSVAVLAAVIVAFAPALLRVETQIWSEPVFTVLVLVFVLVLDAMQSSRSLTLVALSGATAGVAILVRYVGFSLILAGVAMLVILGPRRLRALAGRVAVFVGVATLLVVPWLVHNYDVSGTATGSPWSSTAGVLPTIKGLLIGIGRFGLTDQGSDAVAFAVGIGAVLAMTALWLWRRPGWRVTVAVIPWLVVLASFVGFALASSFIGASDINARILAPAFPLFVLSVLWLFDISYQGASSHPRTLRTASAVGLIAVLGLTLMGTRVGLRAAHGHDLGFATSYVRDSPTVQAVRALPKTTTVVADSALVYPLAEWTTRTPMLIVGDGSLNEGAATHTSTAREIETLACKGSVTYVRSQRPSELTRAFERAARPRLALETLRTLPDGKLLRVTVPDPAVCATLR